VIEALDLSDPATAGEVLELQRAAYRIEAQLIGFDGMPPLHETLEELVACGETFLGCRLDGRLVGAVSYRRAGDLVDVHRLVVAPAAFRCGIGSALVRQLELAERGVSRIVVQTGSRNEPALALYAGLGFSAVGSREVAPGIEVTLLERVAR
jgi:ribosomal protein S18 acetylase RimI-like enzyme